jgi:hypothetical protein
MIHILNAVARGFPEFTADAESFEHCALTPFHIFTTIWKK